MKRLTVGAFAWAVTSAVLLAALSQAGERVMRPEFGAGLKATPAKKAPAAVSSTPAPIPTTGPGGEEILTDEFGRIPPASTAGPGGEEILTDEMKRMLKDNPAWLYPGDEEAAADEESGGIRFGDGIRGKRPPADDDNAKPKKGTRLKGKKILEN